MMSTLPTTRTAVYLFSGLGADKRAFQLLDFGAATVHHVTWVVPEANESLQSYAARLLPQIVTEKPVFIGLSFGGVMALEVAKLLPVRRIILLASIKSRYEISWYFRVAARLGVQKLIPVTLLTKANRLTYWLFGAVSTEDKALLKQILRDTDPLFLTWALQRIGRWRNEHIPADVIHIHGTADHILPIKFVDNDFDIVGGGHFMTLNRAKEISDLIGRYM